MSYIVGSNTFIYDISSINEKLKKKGMNLSLPMVEQHSQIEFYDSF